MHNDRPGSASFSPSRRDLLRLAVLAPAALAVGMLPGCAKPPRFDGSFIQPWRSHLDLSAQDWQQHMALAQRLGCRQIVVQWAGLYGGGGDADWALPDSTLQLIFSTAAAAGLQVRGGLPYHSGWWKALQAPDLATLDAFLALTLDHARAYLQTAPWSRHANFDGWYLPYELEQFNWAQDARQQRLCSWLAALCAAADTGAGTEKVTAISTYFSRLQTNGSLPQLWNRILDQVPLRPMVQDGVGVAGLDNLDGVNPLLAALRARQVAFDVVVELFEELPSSAADGSHFQAQTADAARIQQQLAWAQRSGAAGIFAFALDPWLSQDSPRAQALRRQWRTGRQ
ncbi:DUF4434 domain-containing protein [Xanthomonas graminis]|jgi:hypothetical protein|uniref:DUF4434 domain-containing protein n=1 Tax=Xanthomonas graminis TaxID=3390026 RepID=UPI00092E1807|nr:DUF4434 domain-containing protein [Xanthomonas translucens]SBV57484.1 hypothetical protein XTGICMP6431_0638 [Xanthomonas translucens pv. graminis]